MNRYNQKSLYNQFLSIQTCFDIYILLLKTKYVQNSHQNRQLSQNNYIKNL